MRIAIVTLNVALLLDTIILVLVQFSTLCFQGLVDKNLESYFFTFMIPLNIFLWKWFLCTLLYQNLSPMACIIIYDVSRAMHLYYITCRLHIANLYPNYTHKCYINRQPIYRRLQVIIFNNLIYGLQCSLVISLEIISYCIFMPAARSSKITQD